MQYFESENIELKSIFTDDIKKEVIAMANSTGGVIYVGIADDSTILGVDNADEVMQRISNTIRDAVKPDVTMFVRYRMIDEGGKTVIAVEVQSGSNKPYYLSAKGLRPEGVFVRQGTSCAPASDNAIRQMIKDTDGDNYEDMRSLEQDLTFNKATEEFKKRDLELGKMQMKSLGIMNNNDQYTNLGLLLSDQCPHIIKAAVFEGEDQQKFQNRYEFTGSLLKQIEEAYSFLDLCNQTRATFDGLLRVDHRSYPESAIREALLNAVVHRDYSFASATQISVYSNRLEIISVGGLVSGITTDDIMIGLSICRNHKLAEIFYRLRLIESYGTGMQKILSSYSGNISRPIIDVAPNAFKITLPNLNSYPDNNADVLENDKDVKAVLELFDQFPCVSRSMLQERFAISSASATRLLKKMSDADIIVQSGNGKKTTYVKKI